MSVDLQQVIDLDSIPTFEAIATIRGEGDISVNRPEPFMLDREHQASALSLWPRREPAESADPYMLLVSLLAGRLPSRLSRSSSPRSSRVLLRLEASAGGSWPGWT